MSGLICVSIIGMRRILLCFWAINKTWYRLERSHKRWSMISLKSMAGSSLRSAQKQDTTYKMYLTMLVRSLLRSILLKAKSPLLPLMRKCKNDLLICLRKKINPLQIKQVKKESKTKRESKWKISPSKNQIKQITNKRKRKADVVELGLISISINTLSGRLRV